MRTALLIGAFALATAAAPARADDDKGFEARLAALTKVRGAPIRVTMKPGGDPAAGLEDPAAHTGVVNVAGQRMGLYVPPLITPQDVQSVIQAHMVDIRTCYLKQLEADPEWADRLILDLAIKKTGRVSEVGVAPGRVRRAPIGQCLMRTVPKWKFPEFTGETDDGITQEVVNASYPFSFSVN